MMNKARESLFGEMNIMDLSGHKQIVWTDRLEEIVAAQETFNELIGRGYTAFASKEKAQAKQAIREFDPEMKEMVMVPRTVGG